MLPHILGLRGPGRAIVVGDPGGSGGSSNGGFVDQPIASVTASGTTTIKGKSKAGSFGLFVYPLATIAAGRQYTFRYTPHFTQLAQQGKLAMVGFGLKNNNDFHIVGLRGDGSTGLHKYKVYGTPPNGWNAQTGQTTSDGGASANGTQAGPNYIRLVVSADGATYKFQTSPDNVTYTDEFAGATPSPFSNVSSVTTFGIALWFNNADAGPFSIDIDQFADAAAPVTDPYFANVVLLLGLEGTNGAVSTTDESPHAHSPITFNGNAAIDASQAKFGSSSLFLDNSGDYLSMPDSADWQLSTANSDQFTIEFWMRPHGNGSNLYVMGQTPGVGNWAWYIDRTATATPTYAMTFNFSPVGSGSSFTTLNMLGSNTIPNDQWHFIAISKNASGKIRCHVNGAFGNSITPADSSIFNSTGALEIGRALATANLNAWLDEIRITKGVCRYDTDGSITVPTAAFPRQ